MGLARSTYYDVPQAQPIGEARLVEQINAICAEWPAYGYRRVTFELREQGHVINHKKVMRLMKENGLSVRARRRFMVTTDSRHDGPIFPNLAKDIVPTAVNQLWVADITYITIATGFVYLAAILDAWSRRVVGYAIGTRIDARLVLVALRAAIRARRPPAGCIHHSDRGSQSCRRLSRRARQVRPQGLHGPARQSVRQRPGRELHEDAQGRGGLPDGLRNLRGRRGDFAALHRRCVQCQAAPLGARI
jgi:putative transposase